MCCRRKVAAGTQTTWFGGATAGGVDAGIFHVWASDLADPASTSGTRWRAAVSRKACPRHGSHLEYAMLVTDPEVFTEPVELHRAWVRRPGEAVRPYNCTTK
jgi:hypothetical protein